VNYKIFIPQSIYLIDKYHLEILFWQNCWRILA